MKKANGLEEFYSRTMGNESCELFVDKSGNPTLDYPHVHVVHHGSGTVDVIASSSRGHHVWRTTLNKPSGNEVNSVVKKAQSYL